MGRLVLVLAGLLEPQGRAGHLGRLAFLAPVENPEYRVPAGLLVSLVSAAAEAPEGEPILLGLFLEMVSILSLRDRMDLFLCLSREPLQNGRL